MPATPRPDDLVRLLRTGESARPRLIWHAPGERIELSGRVLATWAAKVADLLQEDLDATVGTRVRLDGAPHWRLLAWAVGAWTVGATVVTAGSSDAEIVVADGARLAAGEIDTGGAASVVGLTRAALARRSPVPLPAGVLDEAAVLATYADETDPYDRAADDDPALIGATRRTYADLLTASSADRVHLSGSLMLDAVLVDAASVWAAGGSVVVTDPAWEAEQGGDPHHGSFARVLASEGVSAPRD